MQSVVEEPLGVYICMARWYASRSIRRIDKDGDLLWSKASDSEIETNTECSRMDREFRSRMQPCSDGGMPQMLLGMTILVKID
jgi:hypothetical protein